MMISMEKHLRQGQRKLKQLALDPRVRRGAGFAASAGSGFFLSALSLGGFPQPVVLGLIRTVAYPHALLMALGAMLGFRFFRDALWQGILWAVGGVLLGLQDRFGKEEGQELLIPALAGVWVSAAGLLFLFFQEEKIPFPALLLQISVAAGSAWYFPRLRKHPDSLEGWIAGSIAVLALCCIRPAPWCDPGAALLGILVLTGSFPSAALGGLGMDLARVTPLPMTAAACLSYFLRCLPWKDRRWRMAAPALGCMVIMALTGVGDLALLPGLLLGGALGFCLPPRPESLRRRGETATAQVRLELTAGVLSRMQQLLLESELPPPDQEALLQKARSTACDGCAARDLCRDKNRLRLAHLKSPQDFSCRKPERIRTALETSRTLLRNLNADRLRRQEYRFALIQQYQFLAEYLQRLSDQLPGRMERVHAYYKLEAAIRSTSRDHANGDRFFAFPGTGCRYYILLCDGMGTGLGAAREGQSTGELLRQMLSAGLPAEYACRSINSLLLLRGQAGAVTVDLAEIRLDTGRIRLFKWGAAPSYVLRRTGAEKIGTATPPPGISLTENRETVLRLSLHRGEALILLSDGAQIGENPCPVEFAPDVPPGEIADRLLESGSGKEDDATVAVVRLRPRRMTA